MMATIRLVIQCTAIVALMLCAVGNAIGEDWANFAMCLFAMFAVAL
jgi:hypothetical protein